MSAAVVAAARRWLGTPYRHQASMLGAGCDCLGLIRGVWREVIGEEPWTVPPYRADRREATGLVEAAEQYLTPADAIEAGTVVLFSLGRNAPPRHCGILVAPSRFVHAQERLGVVEANLTDGWRTRIAGLYRFPEH